jgi:spore coat polysaccharide biosynthesis protein SpsF
MTERTQRTTIDAPALIQARMSSSRLPGKSLLALGDDVVLGHVVRRTSVFASTVVVCTSADRSDDAIALFCSARGIPCVRGPLDDVLGRYVMALGDRRVPHSEWLWRVTADCPLVSPRLAQQVIAAADDDVDFVGVDQSLVPSGISAELVRRDALLCAAVEASARREREHVTLYLYEHPETFTCRRVAPPPELGHSSLRLTLDTREDYARLWCLFAGDPALDAERAIAALASPAVDGGCRA